MDMKRTAQIKIQAEWDEEAKVWVAFSDDIRGLATEAETLEALETRLKEIIPELIELNGIRGISAKATQIPFFLHASKEMCLSV